MAKRMTETKKWDDPWFHSLTKDEKLFWLFLLDKCDHAGIWDVNWAVLEFNLPGLIWDTLKFNGRVIPIAGGAKWFIPKFIAYQYIGPGELNPDNRAHQSVINALKAEGLWPLPRKEQKKPLSLFLPSSPIKAPTSNQSPIDGAKDKDKDSELDKDKDKDKDRNNNSPARATIAIVATADCEFCGLIVNDQHTKCHYCFARFKTGETDENHRCS